MGGFFGAVSKRDIVLDTFFGVDYHSHLGTKFGGMTIYHPEKGFQRQIHNITNTPFRTRFEPDIADMKGNCGIGCISDDDPQPLLLRSHLGLFAITTVGIINNADELIERYFSNNNSQFLAMGSGKVNSTELVGALINRKQSIVEGIRYAQDIIQGSETIMLLQPDGIIVARDKLGRLPVLIGKDENGYCVSFESFVYHKLGYEDHYELGPQEIVKITPEGIFLEELEKNPARFLPTEAPSMSPAVDIDLDEGMDKVRAILTKYPIKTRLNLRGTLIVARDIAHARIKQMLDEGKPMPEYFKKHPVYYAGPAKTPQGMASGSFGPTTAGRMDPYVDLFQSQGGSLVMVAKGNRSQQVTDACRKHGGFYLGSIGGPAAILAKNSIKSVEVVDFPELGMEAVRKIYVENFPAFIIVDDKGNDFFADFKH